MLDLNEDDDSFEVVVDSPSYFALKDLLVKNSFTIEASELRLTPLLTVELNAEQHTLLNRFLNACEEDDDIQTVVHNAL